MKIKDYKCKCGQDDFFFADKGNQTGIYCSYCGKWLKWADKDEQNLSMKQESKTGHWIDTKEDSTNARGQIIHEVICSECNGIAYFRSTGDKYISANICPSCGTHMKDGD